MDLSLKWVYKQAVSAYLIQINIINLLKIYLFSLKIDSAFQSISDRKLKN